jgi:hypothetical protein
MGSRRESCRKYEEDEGSLGPDYRGTETEIVGQCERGHWPGELEKAPRGLGTTKKRPVGRHSILLGEPSEEIGSLLGVGG